MTGTTRHAEFIEARRNAEDLHERLQTRARAENRELTEHERQMLDRAVREARSARDRGERATGDANFTQALAALTGDTDHGFAAAGPVLAVAGQTMLAEAFRAAGQQWVAGEGYRWVQETRGRRAERWASPVSEVGLPAFQAATLTEGAGFGGGLVVPQYVPGITPSATRRVTIADLFTVGRTDSNAIVSMVETTFTDAAATVAEAASKPESTLIFEAQTDPVRKIAHWLPVTEEILEDVPALRAYLDARLGLGVSLKLDDQLISGTNVAPDILGVLNRTGLAAAVARGADTNADAIAKQITAIESATGLPPDGIVLHPTNWQTILLAKNANGDYLSGAGPLSAMPQPTLFGVPVAVSPVIAAGTALVGAFKTGAMLFLKGGMRVEATNSHENFFVKNLVAIRAELRAALAVMRPAAFGTVTGLS